MHTVEKSKSETGQKPKIKEKQAITLSQRLAIPMLIVAIIQCGILFCALIFSGITDKVSENAYEKFVITNSIRSSTIGNLMSQNIAQSQHYEQIMKICTGSENLSAEQLETALTQELILALRRTQATGAYVILEKTDEEGNNLAVYLCDNNPLLESPSNTDISFMIGSRETKNISAIQGSSHWVETTKATNYPFYDVVKQASIHNPHLSSTDLGYWGRDIEVYPKTTKSITYTVPIRTEAGDFLGVVGVEISIDHLKELMPHKELTSTMRSAYVLGIISSDKTEIEVMASQGSTFANMYSNGRPLQLTQNIPYPEVCVQVNSGISTKALITYQEFNVYSPRSPYKSETWAFAGVIDSAVLLRNVIDFRRIIFIALGVTIVASLVGVLVASYFYSRPIKKMVEYMRSYNPEKEKLNMPVVNISEIDQLSKRIAALNDEVTHAASRLSQILSLSNVPIGAIEFDPKTDLVFCTEAIPRLMNFPDDKMNVFRYFSRDFKALTEKFVLHTRPYRNFDEEMQKPGCSTLQHTDDYGVSSWLKIQTMQRGSKRITVVQDVSENIREKLKLEYERDYDALTNLRNRRSFRKVVNEIMKERGLKHGAMVMWDMDNLKYINDHYGHDTGDKYLSEAAKMFSTLNSNRGVVARMSGDEFYAFLYNFDTKEELFSTIERLHNRIKKTPFVPPDGQSMNIRASGGIAWYPDESTDYDMLIKYADFAMYNVKNTCRGELMEFDRSLFERDAVLINGREALNRFIDNRMFKYAFQPIIDAKTGEIFAFEALMRPECAELPTIHEVMRLATSQSRLYQIEQLTMFGSIEAFEKISENYSDVRIFINSIPNTMLSDADIKAFEKQYSRFTERIVIEIIESEQSDEKCMHVKRRAAKRWNSKIALDDYGAGYSTQASLLVIKPDFVKIDMELIRNIDVDENRIKLVENIVAYAKKANIKTIAEGVETKQELERVIELGADYVQGFYFAQPELVPIKEVEPEKKQVVLKLQEKISANSN